MAPPVTEIGSKPWETAQNFFQNPTDGATTRNCWLKSLAELAHPPPPGKSARPATNFSKNPTDGTTGH